MHTHKYTENGNAKMMRKDLEKLFSFIFRSFARCVCFAVVGCIGLCLSPMLPFPSLWHPCAVCVCVCFVSNFLSLAFRLRPLSCHRFSRVSSAVGVCVIRWPTFSIFNSFAATGNHWRAEVFSTRSTPVCHWFAIEWRYCWPIMVMWATQIDW